MAAPVKLFFLEDPFIMGSRGLALALRHERALTDKYRCDNASYKAIEQSVLTEVILSV